MTKNVIDQDMSLLSQNKMIGALGLGTATAIDYAVGVGR
jgi:hypothetical protein